MIVFREGTFCIRFLVVERYQLVEEFQVEKQAENRGEESQAFREENLVVVRLVDILRKMEVEQLKKISYR